MRIEITLNGTAENPYHKLGLKQNPFPQIAMAQYSAVDRLISNLDAEPILDEADLRHRIGNLFSPELIELCCQHFRKGERTSFTIYFNEAD